MRILIALAAAVAALMTGFAPLSAHADEGDLIAVDPASISVTAPAPGHSTSWPIKASNVTDTAVGLSLELTKVQGTIFEGNHPLQVTIVGPDGTLITWDGATAEKTSRISLPALAKGAEYTVVVTASLPSEAGNEYAQASGRLDVQFVAQAADPIPHKVAKRPGLPKTGAEVAEAAAVGTVVGLPFIFFFIARRKRHG